ncbi:MAG: hypothetical protein LLG05_09845 [Porphyromonadaceae bacterium]|nr:hypothetical protein [Porphyromonadaceae bacterium]
MNNTEAKKDDKTASDSAVGCETPGYAIPGELDEVMEEALAAEEARDSAVKGFFKFQVRNAVMLGKISRAKKAEFWKGVYDLYPDLNGKKLSYNSQSKLLTVL